MLILHLLSSCCSIFLDCYNKIIDFIILLFTIYAMFTSNF